LKQFAGIVALSFSLVGAIPLVSAQENATKAPAVAYEIKGNVRSGKTPLPGVSVTASNTLTGKKFSTATATDGSFFLTGLPRGRYVVRAEFMGFAVQTQEVVLNPESPAGKADFELILASRQEEQSANSPASLAAGRGFQSLAVEATLSSLSGGDAGGASNGGSAGGPGTSASDLSSLPVNGAGAEGPTESVSITGAQGRTQDFGVGREEEIQQRIQEFRERAQQGGGFEGFGGGGFGGSGGGGGGVFIMRMGRGFNVNQPHGFLYFSDDTSALDAKSYSLTGLETPKPSYNQARFGANVGGPLNIPKIFNGGNKTFFFVGWNGRRGSSPYDAFSTVPTQAERSGDFSALSTPIYDPATGQQFQFNGRLNVIDSTLITPQAKALLQYVPMPNLQVPTQNFHYVTSAESNSDSVSVRLIHNFGASGPGLVLIGGGPGGSGGQGGGRRRSQNNLNFGLSWTRTTNNIVNPFPSLAGGTGSQGLNASAGWVYGKGRATNNLRVTYNHNHVSTTNLYSTVLDVAGAAQIGGVSTNPFDWGIPGLSFSNFAGLNDPTPLRQLNQTYTLSDTLNWNHGKHNWRFGGDYRRILQSFHSARNGEGSFVFTGFATALYSNGVEQPGTGSDFADFLLGLPQQSNLQSGTNAYNFRANSYDFFAQDDWRWKANLSFNLGLRYEYNGPYTEASNHIVNLDVAPGFASAVPVQPGQTGPSFGAFPASLIQPDRHDFAPRLGLAWRPLKQTVVRAGYGINYNLAQYGVVIQNFAFQPPFAETATNVATTSNLLHLQNAFPNPIPGTVTNNFAVDPRYRLGYVQIWNLDIQHELPGGIVMNAGYNGSKGTRLDIERAITIPGLQPFLYESSAGNAVFHAGTVRFRKRMAKGFGLSATYVYSKSIDDASSIGGGGSVVAQNAFDISADRGLSSFDQRHKFSGNWTYDLPFGENHRFAQKGAWSHILDGWQWSGDFSVASGLPYTIRVLGGTLDVTRGVSGSLRANLVSGQQIYISSPTTKEWFNTTAFCQPQTTNGNPSATCVNPSDSLFGDAGRNILEGPRQVSLDMSLNKTIQIKEFRVLDLRISASNIFNIVQFTSLGTAVNSSTFGEVTGAGSMRRVTMQARFRF
jgi:trimeric autotransporter adhesin